MNFEALPAAKAATGRIEMRTLQGWRPAGTGFVVGERVVLTAMHVVADRRAPAVELRGDLRFSCHGSSIDLVRLSAYDAGDDWALLELGQPAGVSPLPVASDLPVEEHGWWTFGFPGLNDVEGIPASARLLDPSAAYERGTAISLYSEELKGTAAAGLSGAPLLRNGAVYGIFRSDLEEERREGRRSFGHLYATAIGRVLDRADLRSAQPNPYQGMRPFEEDRAEYFFGRETEAAELADRLRASRLAVLQGGSGSGKSSLLRAGLLPLVRAGQLAGPATVETLVFQPRSWPLQELALALRERLSFPGRPESLEALRETLAASDTSLADLVDQELHHRYRGERSRGGLLIVVDQLEELYATEDRDEAQRLLRLLCAAAKRRDSRVWVAGAIRDGFMADLLRPSPDTETLRAALVPVGPIATPQRLRELIVRPAEKAGLTFEPSDLPDLIAQDAAEAPGGLPLLQYALDRLWQERKGNRLTRSAYMAFGGVRGAIAHHAQVVFDGLDEPSRLLAKRVFLRLVWIRTDGPNTRRLLPRSALQALPPEAPALIQRFVAARLLVESAAGIEIAHEALIREWTPLREWVKAAPEGELRLQQIEEARNRWMEGGERREDLLPAHRLRPLADWAFRNSLDVPPAERRFLIENLLATEQRAEDWVPRFPVADIEEALTRPGRTPEEELRLLAGLYAAGTGADRAERLARLIVQQAPNEVGAKAGRLAVDCEGADWLIDLGDREPAVRSVVTALLNEAPTQGKLREKLPKAWRRTVRRSAAIRLAWEQRTTLLFVAATVFAAVWVSGRIWWFVDTAFRFAGLVWTADYAEFGIINMPLWAAAGAYLDKRSAILGRRLTRRELLGFAAVLSMSERAFFWLTQGVQSLLFGRSDPRFFAQLLAVLGTYVVTAILLIPVFTQKAAPGGGPRRWLRVAMATLVSLTAFAFPRPEVPLVEHLTDPTNLTNLAYSFAHGCFIALAAAAAASWAVRAEWRPSLELFPASGRRRLGRAVPAALAIFAIAVLGINWLLPRVLSPASLVKHADRLRWSGQEDRSVELLRQACEKNYAEGCQALAELQARMRDPDLRAASAWAAERGCRLGNVDSCRIWVRSARLNDDLQPVMTACAHTRHTEFCDEALRVLSQDPGKLGWDTWSKNAEELCDAHFGRACAALANAWTTGAWQAPDPRRAEAYRRKACQAGALELCAGAPPAGRATPAAIDDCRLGNWSACQSLPAAELQKLAGELSPSEPRRLDLFRLACEQGAPDACVTFGELRSRQVAFLAALSEAVPAELEIPSGFLRRRLYSGGKVIDGVPLPWESSRLSLLPTDDREDLYLLDAGNDRLRLIARSCQPIQGGIGQFGALLPLPGPLPSKVSAASPYRRGTRLAAGWSALTRPPVQKRADYPAWCGEVSREGYGAVQEVTPQPGGAFLVRSAQPGVHDVLAELRTWPMPDRSVVVAWRVLKTWPAPYLPMEESDGP